MPYPKNQASFDRWKKALDHALLANREPWDVYDGVFLTVVGTYNSYLSATPGFGKLDWHVAKALSWVECGAANDQWNTKPMQIGVLTDPGLRQLLQTPSGKLILPPAFAKTLTMSNAIADGKRNIQAGVGYLFWVLAKFGYRKPGVAQHPTALPQVPARPAGVHAPPRNPHTRTPTAKPQYAIVGWKPFSLVTIAQHYNGGDGNYLDKLQYALSLVNGTAQPSSQPDHTSSATPGGHHAQ